MGPGGAVEFASASCACPELMGADGRGGLPRTEGATAQQAPQRSQQVMDMPSWAGEIDDSVPGLAQRLLACCVRAFRARSLGPAREQRFVAMNDQISRQLNVS